MRLIAVTSIYPNARTPKAAPYIRQQCAALAELCDLEVLGVLPWFPGERALHRFTYHGQDLSTVPEVERIDGLPVYHPRFLRLPRAGALNGLTYATALAPWLFRRRADAVLATWAYPDGVAALAVGRLLGVPTFIQAIGSDVNVVADKVGARTQLQLALPRADGVLAVSRQLGDKLVGLGASPDRVHVIPTGVDRSLFHPRERQQARIACGLPERAHVILFVGRLYAKKGLGELLEAYAQLARGDAAYRLVVIGDGPMRSDCERLARELPDQLILTGEIATDEIPPWMAACDVLTLPSYAEGTPNVVIEALAAGRRVVASDVGGIPDLVTNETLGTLIPPRRADELRRALEQACRTEYDPAVIAEEAPIMSWSEHASRVLAALRAGRGGG